MAFSGDRPGFGDKKILIKTIQTLNQHLPGKRLSLTELLAMDAVLAELDAQPVERAFVQPLEGTHRRGTGP